MDLDCAQLDCTTIHKVDSKSSLPSARTSGNSPEVMNLQFLPKNSCSARCEWDVEADLPNQILLSFSKFRCKIRQALWITRATVKAVGERSAYLVRIAPPSTKDPALLNPTPIRFSLFDAKTQLMLFPLGED